MQATLVRTAPRRRRRGARAAHDVLGHVDGDRPPVSGVRAVTRLQDVRDVAEHHLCSGCGACAYLDPTR